MCLAGQVNYRLVFFYSDGGGCGGSAVDDAAGYDCCHGCATEFAVVEWGVARAASGVGGAECPFVIGRENRDVGGRVRRELSFDSVFADSEDARGSCGEKFHEAHEGNELGVDEFGQR